MLLTFSVCVLACFKTKVLTCTFGFHPLTCVMWHDVRVIRAHVRVFDVSRCVYLVWQDGSS